MVKTVFWRLLFYLASLDKLTQVLGQDEETQQTNTQEQSDSVKQVSGVAVGHKKDINCENFSEYALNCTMNAALMYNSNRKSPPMPDKINEWCNAVKYLTNCALEWNTECREFTDSHFNEESINGHSYVVHNICDDQGFLQQYNELTVCVDNTADQWETCYSTFKNLVDGYKKNTSADWTHYETHFFLCCGRAIFRRCVLETVFKRSDVCTRGQAIVLQKFSVIVSEGDVYQDCEFNMIYKNCPGGDPRPWDNNLDLGQINDLRSLNLDHGVEENNANSQLLHNALSILLLWLNIAIHFLCFRVFVKLFK